MKRVDLRSNFFLKGSAWAWRVKLSPEEVVDRLTQEQETLLYFASCLSPRSGLSGRRWYWKAIPMSLHIHWVLEPRKWLLRDYQQSIVSLQTSLIPPLPGAYATLRSMFLKYFNVVICICMACTSRPGHRGRPVCQSHSEFCGPFLAWSGSGQMQRATLIPET